MGAQQLSLRLQDVTRKGGRFASPYKSANPLSPEAFAAAQGPSVHDQASARSLLPVPGIGEHGPLAGDHEALVEYLRRAAAEASAEVPRVAVSPGQLELDLSGASQRKQPVAAGASGAPMAGSRLIGFLLTDPLGEELLEGTMGGLMAGASQIGSDQPWGQTALETAAAIAGGIGIGMLGRRIGAAAGKKFHPGALRNQEGMPAMVGRLMGSETTAEGLKHQGMMMKQAVQEGLINDTSARMAREAAQDPAAFTERYGLTAETFARVAPQVKVGRTGAAAMRGIESMPPEQRQKILDALLQEYEQVERVMAKESAGSIDEAINRVADHYKGSDDLLPGADRPIGETLRSLLDPAPAVTGEHVGRAAGRFIGDEVGIMGGLAIGSLLAQQLGMESPKDRRIRELEAQLQQAGRS